MSDIDIQMQQLSVQIDFIKDIFEGVNEHFDKYNSMTLDDYKFIVAKGRGRYESRVKNKPSTTGDSA